MSDTKVDSITIRMYNTGSVGDCLLLLFKKENIISYSMLIDCGGINTSTVAITACAEDIKTTCGGKLDLLIVTHQHEDHISGFNLAKPVFDKILVDEVWMSWVEDKSDPIAVIVKKKYGKKLKEFKKASLDALTSIKQIKIPTNVKGAKARIESTKLNILETIRLLEFEEGLSHGAGLRKGAKSNNDAMNYVRKKGKKLSYKLPGDVIKNLKGAEGLKFYILGPPRDEDLKFLKIELNEEEMYHFAISAQAKEITKEIERVGNSGSELTEFVSPFSDQYLLTGKEKSLFMQEYNSPEYKWRQIETDGLDSSSEVALALTRLMNNTSLAMAIEIEETGDVILLPADAQSGNWMSWHTEKVSESLKNKGGKNTRELLENTIFYKVGHHGSHNGTASVSGLDLIGEKHVIAFMPLVQDKVPTAWGGATNFPAKKLYSAIIEKTKGRVVRTDIGLIQTYKAKKLRSALPESKKSELRKLYKKGPNYCEYTIKVF
ncbi:MAG: hypothetical protein ACHQFW_01935 [Chitinophagales bacterium]